MIGICSSIRLPRPAKGTPKLSNSSFSHPAPSPRTVRFFEKMAAVDRSFAISIRMAQGQDVDVRQESQALGDLRERSDRGEGLGKGRAAIEGRIAALRVGVVGFEPLGHENVIREHDALESGRFADRRELEQVVRMGEGEGLPELHSRILIGPHAHRADAKHRRGPREGPEPRRSISVLRDRYAPAPESDE